MENISHIRTSDWAIQSNLQHSMGVAKLASEFAHEFGCANFGHVLGILHDQGKDQQAFQNHIRHVSGYDISCPDATVRHAYVGALWAKKLYPQCYPLLCYPILGHHAGLCDYDALNHALQQPIPSDVSQPIVSQPLFFSEGIRKPSQSEINHLIRVLYSCLVDADFLDTEEFMSPDTARLRKRGNSLDELLPRLKQYLSDLHSDSPINTIRNAIQAQCQKHATDAVGFYSLTVPTGGGKTLSSLVWAINHAVKHHKKRVIIAIPYTSIIVQTAAILRQIFGEENVLEHHSNLDLESYDGAELRSQIKLATENWDYPIVVTTNVQLFESIYASSPSSCRKLHNICNSVVILDEVQTLPLDFLQPIADALKAYQHLFGISVLFTTASQPVLSGNHRGVNPRVNLIGLEHVEEIIPDDFKLYDSLRRVELHFMDEPLDYDDIATRMMQHDRVLCIVNTRRDAKEIFDRLPDEGQKLHLSKMMCAAHLRHTIEQMKTALKGDSNTPLRVVSTQLIEAGVDIDFPIVFRQEAGLDSVLQSAGRCNREGKTSKGHTYVFKLNRPLPIGVISTANDARLNMGKGLDWFAPETMTQYFLQLYARTETFDRANIESLLCRPLDFCFETAARNFKMIADQTIAIYVPWADSEKLINQVRSVGISYPLLKKLGQYSVSLPRYDFDSMMQSGMIEEVADKIYWLTNRQQYDAQCGLLKEMQLLTL